MKKKMLLSAVTLALVLAMSGCGGMKPEEAAARVQESLDAAKESAEKDQELQDLLLEGAGLDLQGQSAENHAEVLARVRSAIGLTASSAEKTEDGFAVTVDVVPVGIGITEEAYLDAYKKAVTSFKDAEIPFSGLYDSDIAIAATEEFLTLAADQAVQGTDARQETVAVTKEGEVDEEAVSAIMDDTVQITWPEISSFAKDEAKMTAYFDLPGTYVGQHDLTDAIKKGISDTINVEMTGKVMMELVLSLNEDHTMRLAVDIDKYVEEVRAFYDENLDSLAAAAGATLDQYMQYYKVTSRDQVLDKLMEVAGFGEGGSARKQLEDTTVSGNWYVDRDSIYCEGNYTRLDMQDDGSLLYEEPGAEIFLIKQ